MNTPPSAIRVNEAGIIKLIDKNIVVLYHEKACRIFHSFNRPINDVYLKYVKVFYIDFNSHPELLFKNKWEWFIEGQLQKRVDEIDNKSSLAEKLIQQLTIPNKTYLTLYS